MPPSFESGPQWLRKRSTGECRKKKALTKLELKQQFRQEACLEGHSGCVNCLEWNQRGDLLASGSDDRTVILWEVFRRSKKNVVQTGHRGNVFSVKFMPSVGNIAIATCASDGEVRITETPSNKSLMNCDMCHTERVKRLATSPGEPNLLWSAGEDGYILQYDTRERHTCRTPKPNNVLIDLKTIGAYLVAKCIAVNPVRSEMLAVGANDVYNRLFDRRFLHQDASNSCTAYFAPGHLLKTNNRSNHLQSFGTTYLSFSPNGSELLASVHSEQVYLFNTYEPWNRFKSFENSLEPLLLDKPLPSNESKISKLRPKLPWGELGKRFEPVELPIEYKYLGKQIEQGVAIEEWKPPKEILDQINTLLCRIKNCPELYRLRANALVRRGWRGDYYQALRDCCCALALEPLDSCTINCLASVICRLGDKDAVSGLHDIIETIRSNLGGDEALTEALNTLLTFKRESAPSRDSSFEDSDIGMDDTSPSTPSASSIFLPRLLQSSEFGLSELERITNISERRERNLKEVQQCSNAFDYLNRFCGHCNMNTDIKEANFFGNDGEFIVGGSDDGAFYIWDKKTANIVKAVHADYQILNCVQPHPSIYMLATSGIESTVKLWSTNGKTCRDVEAIETRCAQNQEYISIDPLDAMIAMLYPDRDSY